MKICGISRYTTVIDEVISIEHNNKMLMYHVSVCISATGAKHVIHIHKAHNEKLTNSEKRQIKSLIIGYINEINNCCL